MEGGGVYGAGKATGLFDYLAYVKKPQVILRAVSWVGKPIYHSHVGVFQLNILPFRENALMSSACITNQAVLCRERNANQLITSLHSTAVYLLRQNKRD